MQREASSSKKPKYSGGLNKPSRWTVVFDTETTPMKPRPCASASITSIAARPCTEKGVFFEPQPGHRRS